MAGGWESGVRGRVWGGEDEGQAEKGLEVDAGWGWGGAGEGGRKGQSRLVLAGDSSAGVSAGGWLGRVWNSPGREGVAGHPEESGRWGRLRLRVPGW